MNTRHDCLAAELLIRLVEPESPPVLLTATMRYDPNDPFAITVDFRLGHYRRSRSARSRCAASRHDNAPALRRAAVTGSSSAEAGVTVFASSAGFFLLRRPV